MLSRVSQFWTNLIVLKLEMKMVIEHVLRPGAMKICKTADDSRSILFVTIVTIKSLALRWRVMLRATEEARTVKNEGVAPKKSDWIHTSSYI